MDTINLKERENELIEKLVTVNRIAKVVKGGRRFSFNALVVVGDQAGSVAIGMGKANEIPDAIRKAMGTAKKSLVKIHLARGNRLPHEVIGKFKCSKVLLKPASPGTGIIAGESVRSVIEQVGIHDILCKVIGSKNKFNVVKATMNALTQLETIAESVQKRKLQFEDLLEKKKVQEPPLSETEENTETTETTENNAENTETTENNTENTETTENNAENTETTENNTEATDNNTETIENNTGTTESTDSTQEINKETSSEEILKTEATTKKELELS